ncbi:HU family DNA-binding protein [Parabacteroides goldsteinii]|uniref:HU family DNA-binding protein n=2 Tax=Parabacteroides goldsteinii TaxID=328812 RepID=UPI00216694ED|nr:HU family DNA-binding protein [Parabacteroides goldsteinii]MCS2425365.1 HU family DNA-binding protein [Parabacteroides goldsteinii]
MNKADLVNELAEKMGISQKQSRKFINTFQAILTERVKEDEIVLQGFGTFKAWEQAERTGRNPRTGISCKIPARRSVKFKPGKFSYISKFHIIISCKLIVYIVMCFYQETN